MEMKGSVEVTYQRVMSNHFEKRIVEIGIMLMKDNCQLKNSTRLAHHKKSSNRPIPKKN